MRLAKLTILEALFVCRNLRDSDRREAFATLYSADPDKLAMDIAQTWGPFAFCAFDADGPVALIGASERWPGVWCCWMLATDRFNNVGKGLTKWVKQSMIPSLVEQGAHRIEAYSIEGHDTAHRWLRFCGAAPEALLRRYGRNGEDFLVFTVAPYVPQEQEGHEP